MKKIVYACLFWVASLSAMASISEFQYLSGTDKDQTVTWDFFCTKGMNSGKWSKIRVPSQWEQQGFGAYNYGQGDPINDEQGLYKYHFRVAQRWKGKKIQIVFEGSMTDTEVKINGKSAGPIHQGAFYQFKYDVSKLLNYESENVLEVTVSKESADSSVNRAERRGDYWDFGGIFRPVYLEALPVTNISRVAIDAKANGSFSMDVFLNGVQKKSELLAQVETMDGVAFGPALRITVPKKAGKVTITGHYTNPLLWNTETPHMYSVVVRLKDAKKEFHQLKQRFGFRTVDVRPSDGIYVNDRKVMFKGVCRHTFWPESGRCSSKKLSILDVNTIKNMNMNAVRMSHYPPDQHFLDVCDSLGLFVLDELAGWQAHYSTETGKRLVKQMVERDVNHPSIVLWDNGNEGGFNKELRNEYAKHDPQQRVVIEPWSKINGTDTKHYPGYKNVENALTKGNLIYFPTEFLHGLYDGGHGSGLDDYWKLMSSSPLSAGGFLWVYADEGIVRKDLYDSIDNHGNNAPDGIMGPHHQKEASFYAIREIWSPVYVEKMPLGNTIPVINRFMFTSFKQCEFQLQLLKYTGAFPNVKGKWIKIPVEVPDLQPGESGELRPKWPANKDSYDVAFLKALDETGHTINTWSWNLSSPDVVAQKVLEAKAALPVASKENQKVIQLSSGKTSVSFSKATGLLTEVCVGEVVIPFENGPIFIGDTLTFKSIKKYTSGKNQVVEVTFDQSPDCFVKWTMTEGSILQLDYQYHPTGKLALAGITFDFPEELVTGARMMINGPYHCWKNRLKGSLFGVYNEQYNNTVTGETFDYPEFKGYYANFYGVEIQNSVLPFSIVSATSDLYLHLLTPDKPKHAKGDVYPPFPKGNISFLNGISAIGTKFSKSEDEGPQSQKNDYGIHGKTLTGRLLFNFDNE